MARVGGQHERTRPRLDGDGLKELALLTEAFDYDLDDLLAFQLNAAEAAFLALEDREALAETLSTGFETAG